MPQKIISAKTATNLGILKKEGLLTNFYLAGGTGLALQLNHRLSLDLDFFTQDNIATKTLIQALKKLGKLSVEKETENSLICNFNDTRLTFLKYDYPLLFGLKKIQGIKVADFRDIACMKIDAISSRGTKKDFIDLFFICQKPVSLDKLLKLFKEKYKSVNYNIMHILKSLSYFNDAEKEPMPTVMLPVTWDEVKKFIESEIRKINW